MTSKIICLALNIFIYFNSMVYSMDIVTINFIKSFIQNERKPTNVNCRNLCWDQSTILNMSKELFYTLNTRVSSNCRESNNRLLDHTTLFLVDLDCTKSEKSFNDLSLLRSPFRWLVLHNYQSKNAFLIQRIMGLPLLADSDFVLATRNSEKFTLTELYKPSELGPTYLKPRGLYNGEHSRLVDTRPYREMFRRRSDIMGHPLTMSNVIQDSNTTQYHLPREDRLENQYDYIAKISWMHVNIAFRMLNATPRYIFSHRWGYKRNGQWSGMINDINTGKADLGTNCLAVSERLSVVVFTDSIAKFKVKFIFRQPPLAYVSNIFTLPFSVNVWIAVILCIIISSATICIATKWEVARLGTNQTQLDGGFGDAMLLTLSALCQQGCSKEPKKLSGRIMLLVVFTALMAMYAAYSANIVVLLQASSDSIKTMEQLARSKMTIAALDVYYNRVVFKNQKDPVRQQISKKVTHGKGQFYKLNEGVELIRQGHFAFHGAAESIYHRVEETFLETEKCDLTEVDFMNAPDPLVPVYKNSPYLELLRVAFKRIHESGIQMAQHKRLQVPKPRCAERISAFSSVEFLNMRPVLIFMLYGIGAAVLILIAEILVYKFLSV